MPEGMRIALLIDCDNVSASAVEGVLDELASYGSVHVRHAHGDWNSSRLAAWRGKLHPNAIRPMQQFAYTKGKNATDSAMIIDAMDLLYSNSVDAFALMTSDCDFTPLVLRLLESGVPVYGFGEAKTPRAFADACSRFIYTDKLQPAGDDATEERPLVKRTQNELQGEVALVRLLRTAVEQTADDDGWAHLARVGQYIANTKSFASINYGYRKLGDLVRATGLFSVEKRNGSESVYIKDIRRA